MNAKVYVPLFMPIMLAILLTGIIIDDESCIGTHSNYDKILYLSKFCCSFAYAEDYNSSQNEYPYLKEQINSTINGGGYVLDGFVIQNSSVPTDLQLVHWGPNDTLALKKTYRYNQVFYTLSGVSGSDTSGFISDNLDYNGKYISLFIGEVNKSSEGQIVFNIGITGKNDNYSLIFVNGKLTKKGWINNNYYETIDPNSSTLIDLPNLLLGRDLDYQYVNKITLGVQKNMPISMDFRVDLNKTTVHMPGYLPTGNQYYVNGDMKKYADRSVYSKTIFHNLQFLKIIKTEYQIDTPYSIVSNGWQISNIDETNETGHSRILITAQQIIHSKNLLENISDIDIENSLLELGDKDILLLCVISSLIVLFFGWKILK